MWDPSQRWTAARKKALRRRLAVSACAPGTEAPPEFHRQGFSPCAAAGHDFRRTSSIASILARRSFRWQDQF